MPTSRGYVAGWNLALLPFARNEATRFISPTKTPEYLAAARPVVSTPIQDVMRPYGQLGLVHIAEDHAFFVRAVEQALEKPQQRLAEVDAFLAGTSWELTWRSMCDMIAAVVDTRRRAA